MKFSDMKYVRPDLEKLKAELSEINGNIVNASSADEAAAEYKKAEKLRPDMAIIINEYMQMQSAIEEKRSRYIDEAAEPTAILLSRIYSHNAHSEDQKRVRERVGYCLGRWVYMIDAFDDIEKDRKSGNYNPFLLGNQDNYEKIKGDLLMTAGEIAKAYDLLEIKKFGGITKNVVYDGLYYETLKVYERRKKDE